jgi:uncharacterized membrane protein YeaQ/YmgE (transglycosylase-associated protein family)
LIGDMILGVAGAVIGGLLLPKLGVHVGFGMVAEIVNATIGAALLLFLIRMARVGGGVRGRFGGYFGKRW